MRVTAKWLTTETPGLEPATPEALAEARDFVFDRWRLRDDDMAASYAAISGLKVDVWRSSRNATRPIDLSGGCKFASLFVKTVFGGTIRGNFDHQHNLISGQQVDLCEGSKDVLTLGAEAWRHDRAFFGNPDHLESLQSCMARVDDWVVEWTALRAESMPGKAPVA